MWILGVTVFRDYIHGLYRGSQSSVRVAIGGLRVSICA